MKQSPPNISVLSKQSKLNRRKRCASEEDCPELDMVLCEWDLQEIEIQSDCLGKLEDKQQRWWLPCVVCWLHWLSISSNIGLTIQQNLEIQWCKPIQRNLKSPALLLSNNIVWINDGPFWCAGGWNHLVVQYKWGLENCTIRRNITN